MPVIKRDKRISQPAYASHVEHRSIAKGAQEIDLNVMQFNTNAFEFYKKLGFDVTLYRMAKKIQ